MRKIQKEQKSYVDVFVAADGTEFKTAEECRKYEDSAYGVLQAKYRKLIIKSTDEESAFGCGSCDGAVEVVQLKTQADIDIVMQLYVLINPHVKDDEHKSILDRLMNLANRAIKENDVLLVGRGYEYADSMWVYGTLNSYKESLDMLAVDDEKKTENA